MLCTESLDSSYVTAALYPLINISPFSPAPLVTTTVLSASVYLTFLDCICKCNHEVFSFGVWLISLTIMSAILDPCGGGRAVVFPALSPFPSFPSHADTWRSSGFLPFLIALSLLSYFMFLIDLWFLFLTIRQPFPLVSLIYLLEVAFKLSCCLEVFSNFRCEICQ